MENYLSIVAIIISVIALIISVRESYLNDRPYIKAECIKFIPDEFRCYSSSSIDGYEILSEENKRIIKENKYKASIQNIDGENYLVFNLLDESSDLENVRLILAPLICVYTNTGAPLNECIFKKGQTKIKDDAERIHKYKIIGKIIPQENKMESKIAYVCKKGQSTSLFYDKLMSIENEFDYLRDKNMAKEIINFEKEEFWAICKNYKKEI